MDIISELKSKPLHQLPYFEDMVHIYYKTVMSELFPKDVGNKFLYYTINFWHIIGVCALQFGVFLPFKYLLFHGIYLLTIMISYLFFNKKCYMTLLANWIGNRDKKTHMLHIRWKTARKVLSLVLIIFMLRILFQF